MTKRAKSASDAVTKPAAMPVWVLTREVNAHDQYGAYFVDVFGSKPTAEMLVASIQQDGQVWASDAIVTRLLESGGGRMGVEDTWYHLNEHSTPTPLAARLEQMRRERDEAQNALADLRDAWSETLTELRTTAQALGEANVALAEARATNARLHRRAQGVDARSPDDADLIRRLRADVRGQAKHAGYVAGYVMRLRCALSDAQHEASKARAKLARVRETLDARYALGETAHDTIGRVLRIIDEKEGGQ